MITLLESLSEQVSKAFQKNGYGEIQAKITKSNRMDLCQFQCNDSFSVAKIYKKDPMVIAQEISKQLVQNERYQAVHPVRPGFINITLTDRFLLDYLAEMYSDKKMGMPNLGYSETIVLDFGGPNIAKPLHIGHLRSAIIGESLKRILRYAGYHVIGDVHLGDWGLPMGLIIAEMENRYPMWPCFTEAGCLQENGIPDIDVDELNEIYPFASTKSKTNEVFLKRAKEITFALQNGQEGYRALWRKISEASVRDLKTIYMKLFVDFDVWNGESDANNYIDELFDILRQKDLLRKSDGAMVVDVVKESDTTPMPPVLIQKSDASVLYATTDLATIIQRIREYNPAKIWYIVDSRQALHFEQVFRCAKKAGFADADLELKFLGFGTMNGKDGKPYKTRDGGVMRLEELLELAEQVALRQIKESKFLGFMKEDEIRLNARLISVAAIKFGDLINHRSKNYIFDIEKFTSYEGKTGPYILYSVSRINSILKRQNKVTDTAQSIQSIRTDEERNLVLTLLNSADLFKQAVHQKAPNMIGEQAYSIANMFSKFYQSCNIVNEPDAVRQQDLLSLLVITKKLLLLFLDLLGIEPVEQM